MAKKTRKLRPWTKEDILALNKLAREGVKTTAIARKLKRTLRATQQRASVLGVKLGVPKRRKKA
jgi:hypothetical protein